MPKTTPPKDQPWFPRFAFEDLVESRRTIESSKLLESMSDW